MSKKSAKLQKGRGTYGRNYRAHTKKKHKTSQEDRKKRSTSTNFYSPSVHQFLLFIVMNGSGGGRGSGSANFVY